VEISTRQLLAPRPPAPIVRQDTTDPQVIRENAERVAFASLACYLLNRSKNIKEGRWAFGYVRKRLFEQGLPKDGQVTHDYLLQMASKAPGTK